MRTKNAKAITRDESEHLARVKSCAADDCERPAVAHGLCHAHYMRLRRAGRLPPRITQTDAEFLAGRSLRVGSGCLEWDGPRRNGYGQAWRHGRRWQAHVLSYVAHVGLVPSGKQINHLCHNRACIDPAHLYAGTQAQNVADMIEAGRAKPCLGQRNGNSKVSATTARAIRQGVEIARVVAERYGVSVSLVYAIRKGLIWKEVDGAQ